MTEQIIIRPTVHLKEGKFHREDGPAVYTDDGKYQIWARNGILHRLDGPALITPTLTLYAVLGRLHREDGPAVIRPKGQEEYWLMGQPIPSLELYHQLVQQFGEFCRNVSESLGDNPTAEDIINMIKIMSVPSPSKGIN